MSEGGEASPRFAVSSAILSLKRNTSAFVGTNQTDELITSGFVVAQDLTANRWRRDSLQRDTDSRARSHSLQSRWLHRPNRQ